LARAAIYLLLDHRGQLAGSSWADYVFLLLNFAESDGFCFMYKFVLTHTHRRSFVWKFGGAARPSSAGTRFEGYAMGGDGVPQGLWDVSS